jgi:hypothetical protein
MIMRFTEMQTKTETKFYVSGQQVTQDEYNLKKEAFIHSGGRPFNANSVNGFYRGERFVKHTVVYQYPTREQLSEQKTKRHWSHP